jgi:hypothetical protein
MESGYGFSCIVLFVVGISELIAGYRKRGNLNLFLSLFGLLGAATFPSFVH